MDSFQKILNQGEKKVLNYIYKNLRAIELESFSKSKELLIKENDALISEFVETYPQHINLSSLWKCSNDDSSSNEKLNLQPLLNHLEEELEISLYDHDFLITSKDKPQVVRKTIPLVIILHDVRSALNVGSIFRSCECLGVEKLILTGYTSTPTNEKLKKTSLGTEEYLPWEKNEDIFEVIDHLKSKNYQISAFETAEKALEFSLATLKARDLSTEKPQAYIFGNERRGLKTKPRPKDVVVISPLEGGC